jgi:hypothetical protein
LQHANLASGFNGTSSGKPGAGRAGIAMIGGSDIVSRFRRTVHFRNVDFSTAHEKASGEVKVTIIKIPIP